MRIYFFSKNGEIVFTTYKCLTFVTISRLKEFYPNIEKFGKLNTYFDVFSFLYLDFNDETSYIVFCLQYSEFNYDNF